MVIDIEKSKENLKLILNNNRSSNQLYKDCDQKLKEIRSSYIKLSSSYDFLSEMKDLLNTSSLENEHNISFQNQSILDISIVHDKRSKTAINMEKVQDLEVGVNLTME